MMNGFERKWHMFRLLVPFPTTHIRQRHSAAAFPSARFSLLSHPLTRTTHLPFTLGLILFRLLRPPRRWRAAVAPAAPDVRCRLSRPARRARTGTRRRPMLYLRLGHPPAPTHANAHKSPRLSVPRPIPIPTSVLIPISISFAIPFPLPEANPVLAPLPGKPSLVCASPRLDHVFLLPSAPSHRDVWLRTWMRCGP